MEEERPIKVDVKVGSWRNMLWCIETWFSLRIFPTKEDDRRVEEILLEKYSKEK
jgi:hypothetical protein